MILSVDGQIEFRLPKPEKFRCQIYMMAIKSAHQNIGATRSKLTVAINDV